MSEDWNEFHRIGKEIKQNRLMRHRNLCLRIAGELNIDITMIHPWHIRLSSKDKSIILDIYPLTKRFHDVTINKRGEYRNLEGFIRTFFS